MSKQTKIQWTDVTDNPIHLVREDGSHGGHWCRKCSPLCVGCYAEAQNQSGFFPWASKLPYNGQAPKNLIFNQAIVDAWARAKKPQRRFVCSMTDLFGEWVPAVWHKAVFDAAAAAPSQTIQLLTKRPHVALIAAQAWCDHTGKDKLPPNIWMGVSVGTQAEAKNHVSCWGVMRRYAGRTFVSYEPALEAVDWHGWEFLDWLLIGGESGGQVRPFHIDWARAAIAWCRQHRVKPFMKQLGNLPVCDSPDDAPKTELIQFTGRDAYSEWVKKALEQHGWREKYLVKASGKGGDPEEWPHYLRVRESPLIATPVDSR